MAAVAAAGSRARRGPQWWRSGVRTRTWWAAAVFALATTYWWMSVELNAGFYPDGVVPVWHALGVTAEIVVGLLFWMWRPGNVLGPLLVGWASMSYIGAVVEVLPDSRLAVTVGFLFAWSFGIVYVWALFAFPNGVIWNRWARAVLVIVAVWALLMYVPNLLFQPTGISLFWVTTEASSYFYLGRGWSGLHLWDEIWWTGQAVVWVIVDAVLIARLWQASPGARRRLLPWYGSVVVLITFIYVYNAVHVVQGEPWAAWFSYVWWGTFVTSAAGAAFGLARVRQARSSVSDLVVELGEVEPGGVRDALARTLGDPTLVLGLWLPERGVWTDERAAEISVPDDGTRGVTYLGERLAVLIHDRDLLDQPRLLESAGSAARLALENGRLQAQLRAQVSELRDSRARIVRAGDDERRRLERDLHDGAQQRLLGIGMGLQLLEAQLEGPDLAPLLEELRQELDETLAELRELARGIHPAVLTDHGLDAAIRTLAGRAAVPVSVEGSVGRLPAHVETAAYFVVAEALANIAKYAHATRVRVGVTHDAATLTVEVDDDGIGGASSTNGSGLRGLADRVGALDGRLVLDSPTGQGTRLRAEIPCPALAQEAIPVWA